MAPNRIIPVKRWELVGSLLVFFVACLLAVWLGKREADIRVNENRALILKLQQQDRHIQQSRASVTYAACIDQNERHRATVARIDDLIIARKAALRRAIQATDDAKVQMALRAQIDATDDSRTTTVSIVDAIAPRQDCRTLVRDRFGFVPDLSKGRTP